MVTEPRRPRVGRLRGDAPGHPRRPSGTDVDTRERARLWLRVGAFVPVIAFCVVLAVAEFIDFRVPLELMIAPGVVALATTITCRDPRRRDAELNFLISFAAWFSVLISAIVVATWPGTALGLLWLASLACGVASWVLLYLWRAR